MAERKPKAGPAKTTPAKPTGAGPPANALAGRLTDVREIEGTYLVRGTMEITVDPYSDDVFAVEGNDKNPKADDKVGLTRSAYDRSASEAGYTVLTRRVDNGLDPEIAIFEALALVLGPTGQIQLAKGMSTMRMEDFEVEVRLALDKETRQEGGLVVWEVKRDNQGRPLMRTDGRGFQKQKTILQEDTPEYHAEFGRRLSRRMNQRQANLAACCETRSRKRVIRALMGLKGTYRREELDKPIRVPVTLLNHEKIMGDPELKEKLAGQLLTGPQQLFGTILGIEKHQLAEPAPVPSSMLRRLPHIRVDDDDIPESIDTEDNSNTSSVEQGAHQGNSKLAPDPAETQAPIPPPAEGAKREHWITDEKRRGMFFGWLGKNKLDREQACEMLGVKQLRDFGGTEYEAMNIIFRQLETATSPPQQKKPSEMTEPPGDYQPDDNQEEFF